MEGSRYGSRYAGGAFVCANVHFDVPGPYRTFKNHTGKNVVACNNSGNVEVFACQSQNEYGWVFVWAWVDAWVFVWAWVYVYTGA